MDDTSDHGNTEQSAVSICFVHEGKVEEHLLSLVNASGDQSAEGLTIIMLDTPARFDVKPEACSQNLIGQSYDGGRKQLFQRTGCSWLLIAVMAI